MKISEEQIQRSIIKWFRNKYCLKHHTPRYAIFSVPNEAAYKNKKFILTGLMQGVSDLIVVIDSKTLYFELKTATGKQSPKQKEFEDTLECNFAIPLKGVGRFRVNIFRQRGQLSIVIRFIQVDQYHRFYFHK